MVQEYVERCYLPAHRSGTRLSADGFAAARGLAAWRTRVASAWPSVTVRVEEVRRHKEMRVGDTVGVTVHVRLGELTPEDVGVEIWHGPFSAAGEIRQGSILSARHDGREGDEEIYRAEIPCSGSGRYGYSARVLPRHADLVNPLTPLRLTWEPPASGG
jgi:starch phosphorylase